jgi:uncharacterized glyoxalase superfamily protein PhnB
MSFKPKYMPQISSYLVIKDIKKSIEFYNKALGFENENPRHVSIKFGESVIMSCQEGAFGNPKKSSATQNVMIPINMYLHCRYAMQKAHINKRLKWCKVSNRAK